MKIALFKTFQDPYYPESFHMENLAVRKFFAFTDPKERPRAGATSYSLVLYKVHIMRRISHLLWVVILAARPRGPPRVLRPPKELSHYIHLSSLAFTLNAHVMSTVTSSDSRGFFYHDQLHFV